MNYVPAAVPVIGGIGVASKMSNTKEQKNGGWLNKYN